MNICSVNKSLGGKGQQGMEFVNISHLNSLTAWQQWTLNSSKFIPRFPPSKENWLKWRVYDKLRKRFERSKTRERLQDKMTQSWDEFVNQSWMKWIVERERNITSFSVRKDPEVTTYRATQSREHNNNNVYPTKHSIQASLIWCVHGFYKRKS